MEPLKIAIVEDDIHSLELLEYNFLKSGYKTVCFQNPVSAKDYLNQNKVDFIITDWMMPYLDGCELVNSLMSGENKETDKFMVSCKSEEMDVIKALQSGVIDFMPKPLRVKELMLRVKLQLDRKKQERNEVICFKDLVVDTVSHEAFCHSKQVTCTKSEFHLLKMLIRSKGKVFSRVEIIEKLNNGEYFPTERSVDVLVSVLRKKIIGSQATIKTIYGVGYRLV